MEGVFPKEPADGWHPGDRAYCVRGDRRVGIERGKVYRVTEVKPLSNMKSDGLRIDGIETAPMWGFYSSRFIKVGSPVGRLQQIADATEFKMWPVRTTP